MFFGVDPSSVGDAEGFACLLSASEMLQESFPVISGCLLRYALALYDRSANRRSAQGAGDPAIAALRTVAASSPLGSVDDLDRFGDALFTGADPQTAPDFYQLAYLAYCATSLFGPIVPRIASKVKKLESALTTGAALGSSFLGAPPGLPAYPATDDFHQPGRASLVQPPQFTPSTAPPPTQRPAPPPTQGPAPGPPSFTPPSAGVGGKTGTHSGRLKQLAEIAFAAFKAGEDKIALAALTAAMTEMEQ
jgi:hypothetical protein